MKRDTCGFTLIEFVLATSFFTTVLAVVVAGYVQVSQSYVQGQTVRRTQTLSRGVMEDILRLAQQSNTVDTSSIRSPSAPDVGGRLCVAGYRLAWNHYVGDDESSLTTETLTDGSDFTLVQVRDGRACNDPIPATQAVTMLPVDLSLQHLEVDIVSSSVLLLDMVTSSQVLLSEDFELFGENAQCTPGRSQQYCSITPLQTAVRL